MENDDPMIIKDPDQIEVITDSKLTPSILARWEE